LPKQLNNILSCQDFFHTLQLAVRTIAKSQPNGAGANPTGPTFSILANSRAI
jgi:hypothetical protein